MWPYVHQNKESTFKHMKFHFSLHNLLSSQEKRWIIHRINKLGGKMGIQYPDHIQFDGNLSDFQELVKKKQEGATSETTIIIDDEQPLQTPKQTIFATQGPVPKSKKKPLKQMNPGTTWQASKRSQNLLKKSFFPSKVQKLSEGSMELRQNCYRITLQELQNIFQWIKSQKQSWHIKQDFTRQIKQQDKLLFCITHIKNQYQRPPIFHQFENTQEMQLVSVGIQQQKEENGIEQEPFHKFCMSCNEQFSCFDEHIISLRHQKAHFLDNPYMQEIDLIIDDLNKKIVSQNQYYLDKFSHLEYMLNKKCTDLFEPRRRKSSIDISDGSLSSCSSQTLTEQKKESLSENEEDLLLCDSMTLISVSQQFEEEEKPHQHEQPKQQFSFLDALRKSQQKQPSKLPQKRINQLLNCVQKQ